MPITTVAPSILTNSPTQYKEIIKKYYPFVRRAHIDISDGTLSSSVTINETAVWWPKGWSVDIHMMTAQPSVHVENLIKLHPNLVILHAEAREDLLPIFDTLKKNGMRVGVAMVKNVYPGSIKPILAAADHAMIFSGKLGEYGGEADLLLAEKAELINEVQEKIYGLKLLMKNQTAKDFVIDEIMAARVAVIKITTLSWSTKSRKYWMIKND